MRKGSTRRHRFPPYDCSRSRARSLRLDRREPKLCVCPSVFTLNENMSGTNELRVKQEYFEFGSRHYLNRSTIRDKPPDFLDFLVGKGDATIRPISRHSPSPKRIGLPVDEDRTARTLPL